MTDFDGRILFQLFSALGAYMEEGGLSIKIVVVGGASLAASNLVGRTTKDVDVIAKAETHDGKLIFSKASPFQEEIRLVIERVARDFNLPKNWLNTVIDNQWTFGLPDSLYEDISWLDFGPLEVGMVGRKGLIPLKLFASIDQGPESKHWQDLIALRPSEKELTRAIDWVKTQDESEYFKQFVEQASDKLRIQLGRHRS
ncbi:hypothetical protein HQ496_01160 [bacterium]|nr:hypothetical protein [bacterium]